MIKSKDKLYTNYIFVTLCACLCCALWGSATPFIKVGYELILYKKDVASTILFAGARFLLAGVLTILIYSVSRKKVLSPQKKNISKIMLVGAFQTVIQYMFFYIGLANTSGVKGTIITGSNAFFCILVSSLIFKQEKLTLRKIIACVVGFIGIVIINLDGLNLKFNFTGDAFVLFSSVSYAISSSLMKRFSKHEDPVIISGYQFIFGSLFMIIVGILMGGKIHISNAEALLVFLYLGMLSAIAYSVWGILLKYNNVSKVSIFTFLTPVFGVLLSKLMLTESQSVSNLNIVITLILVTLGIFILNYSTDKR